MEDIQGKVAIVTGAASGLGESIARALGESGASISLLDVFNEGLERIEGDLKKRKVPCQTVQVDISNHADVERAIKATLDQFGRIDFLINNAGIDYTRSINDLSVEQFDKIVGVNLRGPFLLCKAVFPIMQRSSGGQIISIASTAALRAWPNASAYCASKWGLRGLMRALGTEGRASNIRATVVIPGGMNTRFFDRPDLEVKPDPKNLNDPANVANAVVWILRQPSFSVIQELIITPQTETSWP